MGLVERKSFFIGVHTGLANSSMELEPGLGMAPWEKQGEKTLGFSEVEVFISSLTTLNIICSSTFVSSLFK